MSLDLGLPTHLPAHLPGLAPVPLPIAAGVGAGFGLGLWFLISAITGRHADRMDHEERGFRQRILRQVIRPGALPGGLVGGLPGPGLLVRVGGSVAAAGVVGLLTRWPVAALAAGAGAWLLPAALSGPGSPRARQQRMAELEALATWTESLAATLAAAAGLEQAIVASTRQPPDALAAPLRGLGDAVMAGARLPEALRAFSVDVDNPSTDGVVAALLLAATRGGANLREPLSHLAAATRQEVTARQEVETGRAQIATDTRLIAGISLGAVAWLVLFNRGFLAPYDSAVGQIVLALVVAMAVGAFVWLRRLAALEDPPRIVNLHHTESGAAAQGAAAPGAAVPGSAVWGGR